MFFDEVPHEGDSAFFRAGRDLVAGVGNETGCGLFLVEPEVDGRLKFFEGDFGEPEVRGDPTGEDEVGAGFVPALGGGEVAEGSGSDGVGTVGASVTDHADGTAEVTVDVHGDFFTRLMKTGDGFAVVGLGPLGKESGRLDVAGKVVAHENDFGGGLADEVDEFEVVFVDGVDGVLEAGGIIEGGEDGGLDAHPEVEEVAHGAVSDREVDHAGVADVFIPPAVAIPERGVFPAGHGAGEDLQVPLVLDAPFFDRPCVGAGVPRPGAGDGAEGGVELPGDHGLAVGRGVFFGGGTDFRGVSGGVKAGEVGKVETGPVFFMVVDEAVFGFVVGFAEVPREVFAMVKPMGEVEHEGDHVGLFSTVDGKDALSGRHGGRCRLLLLI